MQPTDRRGLIEAGAAAALGMPLLGIDAAPARAGEVDPELPEHWARLLRLLGRHDDSFGPRDVLACVQREIRLIATHRKAARGALRLALTRVESRWSELAAWLCEDTGQRRARDAWIARALHLATEADYADMRAFARGRQSEFASDGRRTVALAEDALSLPGMSPQTRAWCSRQAAIGHATAGEAASCERHLAVAYGLLDDDSPAPPYANEYRVDRAGTRAAEAACWLAMAPAKAIVLYDEALRAWPHTEERDGGIHRARLALACAKAGELDRARTEGRRALAIAQATNSVTAKRELRQLGQALKAA